MLRFLPNAYKRLLLAFATLPLLTLMSTLLIGYPAFAQSDNTSQRGSAVIDKWCRVCHVSSAADKSSEMAPPFSEIVARPGRDRAFLRTFLDQDHFPMTTFRLFDYEKDEVTAYMMSLKRQ